MYPPVDVYVEIAKLNHKGLEEAIEQLNFDRMHQCFNRMTHALEQVEQYRIEQARKETKTSKCKECGDVFPLDQLIWADKGNFTWVCERCYKEGEND